MRWLLAVVLLAASPSLADVAPPQPLAEAPAAKHPQGIERVATGVIQGGWEYVYASYGLGTLGVLAYAASLFVRRPKKSAV